jgi:Bacterial regulatory protein, arsR family
MTPTAAPRDLGEVLRDGLAEEGRILRLLRDGPRTVPEIAEALGAPEPEVVLWVNGLRRYGRIKDLPKARADDYFRYAAAEGGP